MAALLDAHIADLDRLIAELTALRQDVQHLRQRAAGLYPASCTERAVCHVIPVAATPVALEAAS